MSGPFEITRNEIERLNATEFVVEFESLLHAECRHAGVQTCNISITDAVTIADGGIDAEISGIRQGKSSQFLLGDFMAFQFKASISFSPTADRDLERELLSDGKIKPRVQNCINRNGTYVLIISKRPLTPETQDESESKIKAILGYEKVRVWGPDTLVLFYNCYPHLALKLKGQTAGFYTSHDQWSKFADMRDSFSPNESHGNIVKAIGQFLSERINLHLRVVGDPGIGKTRTVLEATRDPKYRGLVLYFKNQNNFRTSPLVEYVLHNPETTAIIIVDECDDDEASEISREYASLVDLVLSANFRTGLGY